MIGQLLAEQAVDHRRIPVAAAVFDGGATSEGQPYLVMELVEGRPITKYCDAHDLSTRERLEMFRAVCAAVQYAHQNLVIHRDLKPGNILVNEKGEPLKPMRLFHWSTTYLTIVFVAVAVDALL